MSGSPRTVLALAAGVGAAALLLPVTASAGVVLEPTGATELSLDAGTGKALKKLGVSVAPVGPAKVVKGRVAFPITGGMVDDLATGKATVSHSGGLMFSAGGTRLKVTDFEVRLGKSPVLVAKAGNAKVPLLRLDTSKAKITFTEGAMLMVGNVKGSLTPQAAGALNKTFGVKAFTKGIPIGTTMTKATAYATRVTLDPNLAKALTGAGITAAPISPAGANAAGQLVFPVSGGSLAKSNFAGEVMHMGGISLTKGTTKAELTDFTIRTTMTPPDLTAAVGGSRASILTVGLASAKPTVSGMTADVPGATLTLTPAAATLLNQTFGLGTTLTGTTAFGTAVVRAPAK